MKIALMQSAIAWGNVEENLRNFDIRLADSLRSEIIILPEMFASGCVMVKKSEEVAGAEKKRVAACYDVIREKMMDWAESQDALIMGSTACCEGGRYYNRMIVAFPDRHCLYYDKRHCFRMGGENEHFSAGERQLVLEFRGMKIAVFICYDLRFPVWSRNTQGYDLAVYVANWPESRRMVWNTLLTARAIENQAFVAGVNCVGVDNDGLSYAGDSVIVDARGKAIGACREFQEETLVCEIDPAELKIFRARFPALDDRDCFTINDGIC